jgi:hypothetical protein
LAEVLPTLQAFRPVTILYAVENCTLLLSARQVYTAVRYNKQIGMNSIRHTAGFEIPQPVDRLFPLFSPEGEKHWVPGWDYENIMGTTDLDEDYIFLTKSHDHASTGAIWLVKRYVPVSYFVQFYKVEPEDKVGIVTVQCSDKKERRTQVEVSYEYIALSEKGRRFIEGFTEEAYREFIGEWRDLLLKYFGMQNGANG